MVLSSHYDFFFFNVDPEKVPNPEFENAGFIPFKFARLKLLNRMLTGRKKVGNHHRLHHHIMFSHGLMRTSSTERRRLLQISQRRLGCGELVIQQEIEGHIMYEPAQSCGALNPLRSHERPPDSCWTWLMQIRRWILYHEEASLEQGWDNATHQALDTTLPVAKDNGKRLDASHAHMIDNPNLEKTRVDWVYCVSVMK